MYADVSDVRALAPAVPITNTSQPSEGQVVTWIRDQERVLDALFASMGYVTPLTTPVARTIAKDLVTHFVMARVMRSRPNPEQDPASFQAVYTDILKRLRSPDDVFTLGDATVTKDVVVKNMGVRSSNFRQLLDEEGLQRATRDMLF